MARYATDASFDSSAAWTTFDTTRVNGYAPADYGGAFDGRFVYFGARSTGIVVQYDTTSPFGLSWLCGAGTTRRGS